MIETKLISKELSELVSWSVSLLGKAIKTEYGEDTFDMIEKIRQDMKSLRAKPADTVYQSLSKNLKEFHHLSDTKIHQLCNSYSLMLELINRCETAYRAHRLQNKPLQIPENIPRMIIFVLTAHPTEARSPEILGLFESMQELLIQRLSSKKQRIEHELYHLLIMSLKVALARQSKPSVREEANNIYSYILKEEILDTVVDFSRRGVHVAFRSWVGGDKDGHPGVDENTLHESLSMSRQRLIEYIDHKFSRTIELLRYVNSSDNDMLLYKVELVREQARLIQELKANDGVRLTEFKKNFNDVAELYEEIINDKCPELDAIARLMWIFPALVVPLEVREDSGVVKGALESDEPYAITKMLMKLKALANGFDEKWYVRALVLSMVMDSGDVQNGLKLTKMALGDYNIPVVPLFENEQALTSAKQILTEYLDAHDFVPQKHKADWGERFEVMVGYSDSSKENGVLPSRVMISNALREIETTLQGYGLTPIFFHGSGGSIERGGGAIKEQTGWWPKSAINTFKATIQGEMVARSFSSEHVMTKQIETILSQLGDFKDQEIAHSEALLKLSALIREKYSQKIKDSDFLNVIQYATPYSFLHHLKIGSRPSKRAGGSIEKG
ncbi:MAG: phosphoenolpyruvate carboxylase, partial [Gammaproteobacteria bacterium]|nr:phosphoenolpyruvate carboxylase [Gammaproteobacteria bacterium]